MDGTEVKKILRSLLVSSPSKLTVSKLNRDFKDVEGFNIPFKELGYNSLIHFLHSIPDVLKVNGSSFESEITLVVSEKTAHVNNMVMKQRMPKCKRSSKSRNVPSRRSTGSFPPREYNKAPLNRNFLTNGNSGISLATSIPNVYLPCSPLLNAPNYLSPFPKQMNFHSAPLYNTTFTRPIFYGINNFNHRNHTNNYKNPNDNKQNLINVDNKQTKSHDHENNKDKIEIAKVHSKIETLRMLRSRSRTVRDDSSICKQTHSNEGVDEVTSKLSFLRSRAKSEVRHKVSVELNDDENDDSKNNYSRDFIQIQDDNLKKIPEKIKMRLKELVSQYPHGILCSNLPSKYSEMFGEELVYQKYGFHSVITFVINLDDILQYVIDSSHDYKIYDKTKPILNIRMSYETEESNVEEIIPEINPFGIETIESADWDEYADIIPKNVVKLGEKVNYEVIKELKVGETVQIVISEICHPGKFWIYKNDGLLDKLMNEIQSFYRENKGNLLIPEYLLEAGLYCVVHLNEFQRGIIVDLIPDIGGHVKVYFIDYGTLIDIPRMKVFFLMKEFSVLSSQAVKAKLADIKPVKDVWTKSSSLQFRDFISSKHVFVKIAEIEGDVISVYVADNARPLKFINYVLVEEGFAEKIINEEKNENVREVVSTPSMSRGRRMLLESIKMKNAASV